MHIHNPVLRGCNPDPSILRVGDDFYIATSTFEWFPGVQVHHSRDLVHWRLLTRPLARVSQLDLKGVKDSGGVWAPCLSHHEGTYYLVYTIALCQSGMHGGPMNDLHNLLVTAPDIMGPWSEPVHLVSAGFDPSMFHDEDGRHWLLWAAFDHRPMVFMQAGRLHPWLGLKMMGRAGADGLNPFKGILMQEYSHERKALIGEPKLIFKGTALGVTEGPHLYRHGGDYHLMTAEGGTGRDHAVTMARSRTIDGPYEVFPDNPLLTSRGQHGLALQKAGHGSLVQTPSGEWYLAHLCARPVPGTPHFRCPLGRESALQKVAWGADGWLRLDGGGRYPQVDVTAPDLPARAWPDRPVRDHFDARELGSEFQTLRVPLGEDSLSLVERPGFLRLKGREGLSSLFTQALVARRQQSFHYQAETCIEFEPTSYLQSAGLIAWYDTGNYFYLRITHDEQHGKVLDILGASQYVARSLLARPIALDAGRPIHLRVQVHDSRLQFHYALDPAHWVAIGGHCDASILSDEHHEMLRSPLDRLVMRVMGNYALAFTGAFVGLCCQDLSGHRLPADFDYFEYRETPDPEAGA